MFKYMLVLFFKLCYIILHFIISLFMLLINGSLSTISLHRLYNDTWRFEPWHTHLKSSIKEEDINYVSDKLKRKIINNFIEEHADELIKYGLELNGIRTTLYSYLINKIKL